MCTAVHTQNIAHLYIRKRKICVHSCTQIAERQVAEFKSKTTCAARYIPINRAAVPNIGMRCVSPRRFFLVAVLLL